MKLMSTNMIGAFLSELQCIIFMNNLELLNNG